MSLISTRCTLRVALALSFFAIGIGVLGVGIDETLSGVVLGGDMTGVAAGLLNNAGSSPRWARWLPIINVHL